MHTSIRFKVMASLLLLMILTSCTIQSEKEVLKEAKAAAEKSFKSTDIPKPNQELEYTDIYLPERFQVETEESSNIILKDGDQTYIVFYNRFEPATSELGAESSRNESALLFHSFKDDDSFGYIRIMPVQEKKYEMVIGVGGAKITTYTTKKDMAQDVADLMDISRSLVAQNDVDTE